MFKTSPHLLSAKDEAVALMQSTNMSMLWNGSWHSVVDRVQPSGFLPTSVSGGYGGITHQFVRDASGQLIGMLQLGNWTRPTVQRALRFMLSALKDNYTATGSRSYAPHVMNANQNLTRIIGYIAPLPCSNGAKQFLI